MPASIEEILDSHKTRRTVLMGVLNVTPDSFSDGGKFMDPAAAKDQAARMVAEGADILDVGAESTRPGSDPVTPGDQISRLEGILPEIAGLGAVVSIDTTSAAVAEFALDCGAQIINDVSAGTMDEAIIPLAASRDASMVLMHMLGKPKTMQSQPHYRDVVLEVRNFLEERLQVAEKMGLPRSRCIVDPGIGFGKRLEHNLSLLAGVGILAGLGCPVLVGPSRKRFIGELTSQEDPNKRLAGTIAACVEARRRGATIIRVHDLAAASDALKVALAIESAEQA